VIALAESVADEVRVDRQVKAAAERQLETAARAELERACERLLANPLIESYEIALET